MTAVLLFAAVSPLLLAPLGLVLLLLIVVPTFRDATITLGPTLRTTRTLRRHPILSNSALRETPKEDGDNGGMDAVNLGVLRELLAT